MSEEQQPSYPEVDRRTGKLRTRILQLWVLGMLCAVVSFFTPYTMMLTVAGFGLLGAALVLQIRATERRDRR